MPRRKLYVVFWLFLLVTLAFGGITLCFWGQAYAAEQAVVTADAVNVRSGPGTENWVIGQAYYGDRFPVVEKSNGWVKVQLAGGSTGWIAGWLLSLENINNNYAVSEQAVVTADAVNVRSGPGTENWVIGQAYYGDRFPVVEKSNGWVKVQLAGGSTGWIAGWLLTLETKPSQTSGQQTPASLAIPPSSQQGGTSSNNTGNNTSTSDTAVVTGDVVNVRNGPGTSYEVITQVYKGNKFVIAGSDQASDWYKIKLPSGGTGWIAGWLLAVEKAPVSQLAAVSQPETEVSRGGSRGEASSTSPSGRVLDLEVVTSGGKTSAIVKTDVAIDYSSFTLSSPQRLVIDIKGVSPEGLPSAKNVNSSTVQQVRTGYYQKDPDITRLVFDLKEGAQYIAYLSEDKKKLTVETYIPDPNISLEGRVIAIDPGHGGPDPGAIGQAGTKEKDITLDVAKRLAKLLEARGAKVVMTRTQDVDVGLYERTQKANKAKADIFISIHINANTDRSYTGTSTYIYSGTESSQSARVKESERLAKLVQSELVSSLKTRDIGVKKADFVVLRTSNMPAVLAELAFISNAAEEKLIRSEDFKNKAAGALAKAVGSYFAGSRTDLAGRL